MAEPKKILLAMKHQRVCDVAARMIRSAGHDVEIATNLRNALALGSSEDIGLMVCGVELDDISGVSLLTFFKNDPLRERIPFVFFAHDKNGRNFTPKDVLALGAKDCIFYPISEKEFISRIRKNLFLETEVKNLPTQSEKMIAEVSSDEKNWSIAQIISHTGHGAMIETGLTGRIGVSVDIKYLLPDGFLIAKGKLMHILLGDREQPMGLGINFGRNENWLKIHTFLKSPDAGQAADNPSDSLAPPPADISKNQLKAHSIAPTAAYESPPTVDLTIAPYSPYSIEVSRDGNIWMRGKIFRYSLINALIRTPILGKPGNDIYLKCVLIQGQKTVKATIEKLSLDDLQMPAGMEVVFSDNEEWPQITELLDELNATLVAPEKEDLPPPLKPVDEKHSETVLIVREPTEKPDFKIRFYESLIGKQMGNYEIVSLLGKGSMGGVFEGWDFALERSVALKVISYDLSSKKEFVDMFFKEARYISQLNHPNISHVYYIGKENDILYYVMEFVQGETLADIIKRTSRLPAQTAVAYLRSVCNALSHVWDKKIIHRDIKPGNIMVTKEESIKIVDFGVAQQYKMEPSEIVENMAGSPPYLCPEAIKGHPLDHRSDIYSLGATFYHALSGAPPFMGHSVLDIFRQHISVVPPRLREKHADIPEPLSNIIHKMLAKASEDRFQTYQEISLALDRSS